LIGNVQPNEAQQLSLSRLQWFLEALGQVSPGSMFTLDANIEIISMNVEEQEMFVKIPDNLWLPSKQRTLHVGGLMVWIDSVTSFFSKRARHT